MPRGGVKFWNSPRYFWIFPIEPEPGRPKDETWAYGKGLGGSSALNGTMYLRGEPGDYDSWQAQGNEGWNWNEIERCFKELEDFQAPGAHPSRGKGGPVQITVVPEKTLISEAVIAAGEQMGLPRLEDVNAPSAVGVGYTQTTVDGSRRRVSGYTAFLKPAMVRKNFTVMTGVRVNRILFEGTRARSVSYSSRGSEITVNACKEVIVCAGVLQSPKLLQLSGIGPRELLYVHNIPLVHDLPAVGQNMTEHPMFSLSFRLKGGPVGMNREFRGWRLLKNVLQYFVLRSGVMSYTAPEITALLSTSGEAAAPDVHAAIAPFSFERTPGKLVEPGRARTEDKPGITVTSFFLRPRSRGSVSIRSADVNDAPRIQANWLTDERDCRDVVAMIKLIRRLMNQPALKNYVGEETAPGTHIETDEQLLEAARGSLSSGLHGTGTCRMGNDANSVVDARLRVHGVSGLRVVDCSVMPTCISGNTNGPAMAVALRASELILQDRDRDVALKTATTI